MFASGIKNIIQKIRENLFSCSLISTNLDVDIMFTIRAVRVDILSISQKRGQMEGGERKGLIKEMGFHFKTGSIKNSVHNNFYGVLLKERGERKG